MEKGRNRSGERKSTERKMLSHVATTSPLSSSASAPSASSVLSSLSSFVDRATVEAEAWYICGDLDLRPRLALVPHHQIGRPVDMSTHTNDGVGVGVVVVGAVIGRRRQRRQRSSSSSWSPLTRTHRVLRCVGGRIDPSTVAAGPPFRNEVPKRS